MCGIKEFFTQLNEKIRGEVIFRDQSKFPIKEKRKTITHTKTAENRYIFNVYYVPT